MKHVKELKIGIFVVTVLVVSFFLINYLRGEDIFNREVELVSTYSNIEGLTESAPVYIKGFKAGKVSEVAYDPESEVFNVTCSILKDYKIPVDSRMTIYSVDIMGGKGIRIDLGASDELASDGDYLEPSFAAGLLDGLEDGLAPLLSKVNETLDTLNVTMSGVNKIFSDQNLSNLSRTLAHLEQTMSEVKGIASTINGRSSELESFISNLSDLSHSLEALVVKADTTMTTVSDIVGSIDEKEIECVVSSFNELLDNLNDPDGSIGKLFVDDSIYNSLDSLLNDVDILVKKIQENPKKYIRISIF